MDACHIFPRHVLPIIHPRWGVCLVLCWPEPALYVGWGLVFALWLSQPCQGAGSTPQLLELEALRSGSQLPCEVGGTRAPPLGAVVCSSSGALCQDL